MQLKRKLNQNESFIKSYILFLQVFSFDNEKLVESFEENMKKRF